MPCLPGDSLPGTTHMPVTHPVQPTCYMSARSKRAVQDSLQNALGRTLPNLVQKPRILVCAHSNAATDELLERVMRDGFAQAEVIPAACSPAAGNNGCRADILGIDGASYKWWIISGAADNISLAR